MTAQKQNRWRLAALLAGLLSCGQTAPEANGALPPVLTNAQQVIALGLDARQAPYPVRLRAVVTYPSVDVRNRVYLQDETAGIQVAATNLTFEPAAGELVEVEGIAAVGPTYNFINQARMQRLGTAPLPEPKRVSAARLAAGAEFAQWIAVEATVHDVTIVNNRLVLNVVADEQLFPVYVTIEPGQALPVDWLNARVEVRGIPWIFYGPNNKPSGFRFHAPRTNFIAVLRPGSSNLFACPLVAAKDLRSPPPEPGQRVKVSGVVTHHSPAGLLFLQDQSGPVRAQVLGIFSRPNSRGQSVEHPPLSPLRPGDRIEIIGTPASGQMFAPLLLHAEYRVTGWESPPPAIEVDSKEVAAGRHDGELIRLKARLVDRATSRSGSMIGQTLWLQTRDTLFEALLESEAPVSLPAEKNSYLEVIGVCAVQPGELKQVRSFLLHLRDGEDVRVLRAPAAFLSTAVLRTGGMAGVILVAALAWVALLRRQVGQRTAELSATAEHLRQSEERFSKAFRASSALLGILDGADGRYLDVNDAFLKAYGFTRDEVVGRTSLEINLWQDPSQRAEAYRLYEEQGCLRDFESRLRTRSGEPKVVLQSGDFITIGQRRCILSVGIDITHREQAAAELLKTLAREKELGELKSSFISMVSHEFRTPLGVIMSAADVLARYLDRLTPEKREKHLQMIFRATHNLAQLVEEVLVLGKVEQGSIQFTPAPLDVITLCRQLTDEVLSATERRCSVEFKGTPLLEGANGDASLLRHVLTNLLTNAVKYSEPGERIEFTLERSNGDAVFTVRDHGIGIPEEDRKNLFKSFARGRNVGERPGTGLGLLIVKRCVDLHRGTIDVASKTGVGTTVTVKLPMFDGKS